MSVTKGRRARPEGRGRIASWLCAAAVVLAMAGCGGGDPSVPGDGSPSGAPTAKGTFSAVVSFGDSLSDVGTYAPATSATGDGQPPYIGGKFTTNSASSTVWVENLAGTLGLVVTPAEVGFRGTSVKCPVAAQQPALAGTCTGYGQGGARVTDPNGIGKTDGALTVPVATQIANHLERFTSFKDSDLVLVYAGNNDVLVQFAAFGAAAAQIAAQEAAGELSADEADRALFDAQSEAQGKVKQAAQELAALIRGQILAKGASYVAVMQLTDIGDTPLGQAQSEAARGVLSSLCQLFNLWLRDGLEGEPVGLVDTYAIAKENYANPSRYGIENNTVPACDAAKILTLTGGEVDDGSSLFCNATEGAPYNGLVTGASPSTWQFADRLHPTTVGHRNLSDAITAALRDFGWL